MNKRGVFLVELLISISLFALMTMITSVYFFKFLKEKRKLGTYIENQNVDKLLEHFFEDENNCTETLKGLSHNDSLLELKLASKPKLPVSFYQDLLSEGKLQSAQVQVQTLKGEYGLATVSYTAEVLDLKTKEVKGFENKKIPIFVSLNEDHSILKCFINGFVTSQCKGDYKNVIFYNESSLIPVLYNLVEEPQNHGTEYKTTMSQIYQEEGNIGVQCQSHLYCDQGEWMSSVSCYNSCQDKVWSLGDDNFEFVDDKKCQTGDIERNLKAGQLVCKKNKVARKKWCASTKIKTPYSFDLSNYCNGIKTKTSWKSLYSSKIQNICNSSKKYGKKGILTLPPSDFGKIVKVSKPIKIKELQGSVDKFEIGQVSLYARCEHTGFFSILGLTEDAHGNITGGTAENQRGREKVTKLVGGVSLDVCEAEYLTKNKSKNKEFLCDVNQKIKICDPERPTECPIEKQISELYPKRPTEFSSYLPQGLPLRFFYNHSENDPDKSFSAFYTVMCDKKGFCSSSDCMPEKSSGSSFRVIKAQTQCGGSAPQLDLVFVIDSSGSMGDDQVKLHGNLHIFLDEFLSPDLNLDYHIAVLDTESGHGLFRGNYLCKDCKSSHGRQENIGTTKSLLKERVKTGTYGSLEYSLKRLSKLYSIDSNFFRKNATLAIFFLTDEEDQDYKDGYTAIVTKFLNFLQNKLRKDMQKVLIYLGRPINKSKSCPGTGDTQAGLISMLKRAKKGGAYTSQLDLCDTDWTDELIDFGRQIRNSLLQNTPLNSSYDFSKVDKKGNYKDLTCK